MANPPNILYHTDSNLSNMPGTRDTSQGNEAPVQASMPPPPVTMASSMLKRLDLQLKEKPLDLQLEEKDKIICTLQGEIGAYLAGAAEKAREREYAKMNKGWRKHNATPPPPSLLRRNGITEDEKRNINFEKTVFVSEYRLAMDRVKEKNAEAQRVEARIQTLRQKQMNVYRKTQELSKVAGELEIKLGVETIMRIARSSPEEDQDTTTADKDTTNSDGDVNMGDFSTATAPETIQPTMNTPMTDQDTTTADRDTTKSDGDVNMGEFSTATAPKPIRLRLNPPKLEQDTTTAGSDTTESDGDENMGEFTTATAPKPFRLILNPPKLERSLSVANSRASRPGLREPKQKKSQPSRARRSMPKRKHVEESPLPVEAFRPRTLKINPPKPKKARDGSDRVLEGRAGKASAKTRK